MASTEGAAVVTAHDWIRGITFSILASIIGGASKLSIRKSWLIDARRKQQHHHHEQQQERVGKNTTTVCGGAYEEILSSTNNHISNSFFENESSTLAPLEVSSPTSISNHPHDESFSSHGDENENEESPEAASYFFNTNVTIEYPCNNTKFSISPKQISWLLYLSGMVGMSFLNPLCCVLAMKYANPSILAPFSGLTLVWVVLFSGMVVGEYPGRNQKVACALIVAGEVLVALFGDHTNGEDRRVEDVISSYQEPAFQIFIIVMTLYLVQLGIFIWVFPKHSLLRKVAWGSIGGTITGFQNFLKDALTIFDVTTNQSSNNSLSNNGNDSLPPVFFLFVFLAMFTSFVGLLFLAACMKRYDTTYSAAMFVVSFVISASCMSSVHYHTFEHLDGFVNYIMYPLGLMTLFMGAFLLVKPVSVSGFLPDNEDDESIEELSCSDLNDGGDRTRDYQEILLDGE